MSDIGDFKNVVGAFVGSQGATTAASEDYNAPLDVFAHLARSAEAEMRQTAAMLKSQGAASEQQASVSDERPAPPVLSDERRAEALERYGTGVLPWSCRIPPNQSARIIADAMQDELNELRPLVKAARAALSGRATIPSADWIADVVRDVAELPDRDSPADQPDMMLVGAEELRAIIERRATIPSDTSEHRLIETIWKPHVARLEQEIEVAKRGNAMLLDQCDRIVQQAERATIPSEADERVQEWTAKRFEKRTAVFDADENMICAFQFAMDADVVVRSHNTAIRAALTHRATTATTMTYDGFFAEARRLGCKLPDDVCAMLAATPDTATTAICWSCKRSYTAEQRADADGNCPHCGVEIEQDATTAADQQGDTRDKSVLRGIAPALDDAAQQGAAQAQAGEMARGTVTPSDLLDAKMLAAQVYAAARFIYGWSHAAALDVSDSAAEQFGHDPVKTVADLKHLLSEVLCTDGDAAMAAPATSNGENNG